MKRSRVRLWLIAHLPDGLLFHPAEGFLALICAISGLRILTLGQASTSLAAVLPPPLLAVWGAMLLIGSIALGSGLLSIRRVDADRYVVTRVPPYRLGLRLLGWSALLYACVLVGYAGSSGLLAALFPLAFSGMCGVRLLALGGR